MLFRINNPSHEAGMRRIGIPRGSEGRVLVNTWNMVWFVRVRGGDVALETFHFTLNYQTLSVERLPQPPPSTTVAGGGISRHRGFKVVGPRIQITLKGQKYYKIVFSSTYFPICWKECQIIVQCRECTSCKWICCNESVCCVFLDLPAVY